MFEQSNISRFQLPQQNFKLSYSSKSTTTEPALYIYIKTPKSKNQKDNNYDKELLQNIPFLFISSSPYPSPFSFYTPWLVPFKLFESKQNTRW